jgi:alpha-L-rhamnosidase
MMACRSNGNNDGKTVGNQSQHIVYEGNRGKRIHNCYNSIGSWFIQRLAGIRPDPEKPGFQNAIIEPVFLQEIRFVQGSQNSSYGRIESNWRREGDSIRLSVKIPPNSTATVILSAKAIADVTVNGASIQEAEHVTFREMKNERVVVDVGSGSYEILCK